MYVASWSGGKDCCLAMWLAQKHGCTVHALVNMINDQVPRVRFHGTRRELIRTQARCLGIELVQRESPGETYTEFFIKVLNDLRSQGVEGMIFGDIWVEENRQWGLDVCAAAGIEALHPLWGMTSAQVMTEFLTAGFRAMVVSGHPDHFSALDMGRIVDAAFVEELDGRGVDVAGENGEYHTVVLDGPRFDRPLEVMDAEAVQVGGHWFYDIRRWSPTAADESST